MTLVNLNPRPDGRGINSSPVPALIPLEKFYKGCQYQLRIAGEVVRATLATPYTVPERTLDFGSDGGARTATWYYGSFGEKFFSLERGSFNEKTIKRVKRWEFDKFWPIFQAKYKLWHILDKRKFFLNEILTKRCQKGGHSLRNCWKLVVN